MNGGGGGISSGDYDLCEMEEDAVNNNSGNGGMLDAIIDSSTGSSATTTGLSSQLIDEPDNATTTALKSTLIKQNGSSKIMSIAHSYNYTGKRDEIMSWCGKWEWEANFSKVKKQISLNKYYRMLAVILMAEWQNFGQFLVNVWIFDVKGFCPSSSRGAKLSGLVHDGR